MPITCIQSHGTLSEAFSTEILSTSTTTNKDKTPKQSSSSRCSYNFKATFTFTEMKAAVEEWENGPLKKCLTNKLLFHDRKCKKT